MEIACVGLEKDEIKVSVESNTLKVAYRKPNVESNPSSEEAPNYVHRGITRRSFDMGWKISADLLKEIEIFDRQALHAISLGLIHPKTNKEMKWTIDLPEDMKELLSSIRKDSIENDFGPTDHFLQQDFELNDDDLTFDDEK